MLSETYQRWADEFLRIAEEMDGAWRDGYLRLVMVYEAKAELARRGVL